MNKSWICLGITGCSGLLALFFFSEGMSYLNVRFDEYLYIVLNGYLLDIVTTTAEANTYAFLFIGVSMIPAFCAYYFYRKFLKMVPVPESIRE